MLAFYGLGRGPSKFMNLCLLLYRATLAAEKKRYKLIEDMFTEPESFNSTSLQKDLAENITLQELYLQGAHKREDFIFR